MTDAIAIIPARGGSKRVPSKNLLPLGGLPLIAHTVGHAVRAASISATYVSTDDAAIAAVARAHGATVVCRPDALSGDHASSEAALLHVLDTRIADGLVDPDLVVFLQCTAPVRAEDDVDRAIEKLLAENADSLVSATEGRWFIWGVREGVPAAITYDYEQRQREQDMGEQWRENGSLFVFKPSVLREGGNRLGGKITLFPMDYWSSFQVDSPEDARLLDWILTKVRPTASSWPARVDLVVFDFDGVMTDNTVLVDGTGGESVRANRGDGLGIARLREAGIPMFVLSTETHPVVAARCAKLGLEFRQGLSDKGAALEGLLLERGIDREHVIYVGNDVNDLTCFRIAGFPVAVADAHPDALAEARFVLSRPGGGGAVRELCDLVAARRAT